MYNDCLCSMGNPDLPSRQRRKLACRISEKAVCNIEAFFSFVSVSQHTSDEFNRSKVWIHIPIITTLIHGHRLLHAQRRRGTHRWDEGFRMYPLEEEQNLFCPSGKLLKPFSLSITAQKLATSRELRRMDSVSRSPIYASFSETLDGSSTIRAFKSDVKVLPLNLAICTEDN
ncbi:hypothetical protein M8C21_020891 [Ambrosia artemisiifolia]|uniref:Uncharacterized protein n=1 Tax=Ambrosia artemisiifolia TaxID=4212 RepID=A0AAD5CL46_AMBAR|nr:hypothetical protein M8C21_020891 [Ambrosia artemisiifolia]